jgi:hypothetical protein
MDSVITKFAEMKKIASIGGRRSQANPFVLQACQCAELDSDASMIITMASFNTRAATDSDHVAVDADADADAIAIAGPKASEASF